MGPANAPAPSVTHPFGTSQKLNHKTTKATVMEAMAVTACVTAGAQMAATREVNVRSDIVPEAVMNCETSAQKIGKGIGKGTYNSGYQL